MQDLRSKKFFQQSPKQAQKGFTMIELLLYMGIFSILLVVLLDLLTMILGVHAESQATSSVDQDGNYIMRKLAYDIHKATTITPAIVAVPSTSMELTGTGFDETYTIDGSDNLVVTDNTVSPAVRYSLNSPDTKASITFTPYGNTGGKASLKIALILTSRITQKGGVVQSQEFDTTVAMR